MQSTGQDDDFPDDAPVFARPRPAATDRIARLSLARRGKFFAKPQSFRVSLLGGAIGGVISAAILLCVVLLLGPPAPTPVARDAGAGAVAVGTASERCANEDLAFSVSISQGLQFWAAGSITSEMMARRDLPEIGLRLQILRGKLYLQIYPDGYYYIKRSESMIQQIRDALLDFYPQLNGSSATGPFGDELPPDMDLRFDVADRPVISSRLGFARDALVAPVMTMCASADTVSTAVPDFSFDRWHDTGVGEETSLTYMELINRILSVADGKSYESRLKKATFRGHLVHPDRNLMRQIFVDNADIFDLGFGDNPQAALVEPKTPPLAMAQHPEYAVQVYLSGNGYSARLKYLLATGSPVVYLMSSDFGRQYEWFLPVMRPGIQYLPVYSPKELVDAIRFLLANPQTAKAMGAAGQAFVRQRLLSPSVHCWWRRFFHSLAPKLAQPIQRMHQSVAIPWDSTFEQTVGLWRRLYTSFRKLPAGSWANLTARHPAVADAGFLPEDDFYPY